MSTTDDDLSKLHIDRKEQTGTKRRRRALVTPFVLLLLIGAALLYATENWGPSLAVKLATVSQSYPSQSLSVLNASGYVVAQRKAAVASKITGLLVELLVEEGDPVKKDQVVARLENEDVLAARDQALGNLAVARAALEEAKAELTEATLSFERTRKLYGTGALSRSAFDTSEARFLRARAAVSSAEAAIQAARAAVRSSEVALDYTYIQAPFDAVVLTKDADVGDIVTPLGAAANAKASVISIADLDSLQVEVDVSETNLSQVRAEQPCEIQLDALPGARFRGRVHAIVPTADRAKASVQVKVRFVDKDPRILPEMSAKVSFLSRPLEPGEIDPYLAVNRSALFRHDGGPDVFVVRAGRAVRASVRTGRDFGDMAEILEGLRAGDKVVLEPPARLKEGSRVKPAEE
ncbi:MAG: efflux RND transporter periplasmic adaptor subunit [bacterium]